MTAPVPLSKPKSEMLSTLYNKIFLPSPCLARLIFYPDAPSFASPASNEAGSAAVSANH
jgi:hypothetical protein